MQAYQYAELVGDVLALGAISLMYLAGKKLRTIYEAVYREQRATIEHQHALIAGLTDLTMRQAATLITHGLQPGGEPPDSPRLDA